jgi:PAS domain S-box-containing protein
MNFSVHGEISMTASMSTTITLPQKCDRLRQSEAKDPQAQLLSTIAQVANLLLRSTDYTIILPDVMRLLGEAVGCDRCSVIQEIPGSDEIYALVEWSRPGINLTLETTLEMESLMVWSNFTSLHEQYARGESTNFLVADIEEPGRSILSAQGCTSMLIVPIMVAGKCWGEIGFDNCGEPRLYDDAEIAILRIAADSLAAAIERQAKDEELRKSEALYRSLFDISNEGIYYSQFNPPVQINLSIPEQIEQCYQRFCLTKANDTFAQMYGLERGEDMIGLKLSDVYLEASEKNQAFIRAVVENGHRVRNMESEEIDANGRKRYFLNSVINQIENNVAVGSWGTQIDITELREAQQALLQAERERVAQLEDYNQQLRSREYWLEATALAANALVSYPTLETALNEALRLIGETVGCDRAGILQHIQDETGTGFVRAIHEWNSQNTFSQLTTDHIAFSWSAMGLEDWLVRGQAGELCGGLLDELPEPFRSIQAELDVQATYNVPIFVAGQFWGVLGIDYCGEPKRLIAAEVGIFKTIANCIGSAIERQRTQQALLEAEQRRVAELAKTNRALKNSIDRLAADPDLNAFLGHVLQAIAQELNAPVVEHWLDTADNQSYLNLSCCRGELLTSKQQADDPRVQGIHVTPDLMEHTNLLKRQRPCVFEDLVNDPRQRAVFDSIGFDLAAWSTKHNVQKYIHLPLLLGDESIGTLCIYIPGDRTFSQEQIELMQALAQQATLAIALTRLAEESHQLAIIRDRTHLAREIHDTLAQGYAGILMQIQAANFLKQQPDQAKVHLDRACVLAREGIADARRSVWLLQQESEAYSDVSHILVQLVEQMSIGAGIKPTVTIEGNPHNVPPDTGMHLLRITQESLNNALRHAKASKISIHLHYTSNQLQMTIQDDGCGFESEASTSGFGIKGMGQRADLIGAELQIHSQRDRGTQIELSISLA